MWQRRTFHECAEELSAISVEFRTAHTNTSGWDRSKRDRVMHETSQRGVELLLFLAVSVRNDQDYGLTDETQTPVGALKLGATQDEAIAAISEYHPPYDRLIGFTPLGLRQAMNKIVHLNPSDGGFFADEDTHDLIVSGMDHRRRWLAVISLIDLCRVIKSVPDARTSH